MPTLIVFFLSIILPLTPYMINGAPSIGDSWVHIRYAEDIVEAGGYSFNEYNRMWPLINMLLAFLRLITGMPTIVISQFIPGLAGLSSLIIYLLLFRLRVSFASRLIGILAFSYTPLYTSITFYSATMKETATLYPLLTLLYITAYFSEPKRSHLILNLMAFASVILGHHFGGLVALLYLLSTALQRIYESLAVNQQSGSILPLTFIYAVLYLAWNFFATRIIGLFFEITIYDAFYIVSFFTLLLFSALKFGNTLTSILTPILTLTALAGFRGIMHESITFQTPITVYEIAYYLAIGIFAAIGLKLSKAIVTSLNVAIMSIYLACTLWDVGYTAIVLFTKSLHYLSVLIAIGLALFCEKIERGRRYLAIILALILILESIPGLVQALKGLSEYSLAEILSLSILKEKLPRQPIYADTRLNYLAKYLYSIEVGSIPLTGRLKGLLLLSCLNEIQGLLYGYERIQLYKVLSDASLKEAERYYDSLKLFLIYLR
ncbi:MAG: hypothetical protein QXX99_00320 [Candidatus Bathyarchaeia archaeon]